MKRLVRSIIKGTLFMSLETMSYCEKDKVIRGNSNAIE